MRRRRRRGPVLGCAGLLALAWVAAPPAARGQERRIVAYAAASLRGPLEAIARRFMQETRVAADFDFGSSGSLARRIVSGAPADVFLSASRDWVDELGKKGFLAPGTRAAFARNTLVCVVPADEKSAIARPGDLPGLRRVSMGDPAHVPAGFHAREALRALGLWERLQGKLIFAQDVRAALAFVEGGGAPAGIVYGTDARLSRRVRVAFIFPESAHPPVLYWAAAIGGRPGTRAAEAFVRYLKSEGARAILEGAGFLSAGTGGAP